MGTTKSFQQTFELLAKHLLTQARKAYRTKSSKVPTYVGYDHTLSPFAACIPANERRKIHQDEIAEYTANKRLLHHTGHSFDVVCEFENIHDFQAVETWPERIAKLQKVLGIESNVINENIVAFDRGREREQEKDTKKEPKDTLAHHDFYSESRQANRDIRASEEGESGLSESEKQDVGMGNAEENRQRDTEV